MQKKGRGHEYEVPPAYRPQCRRDFRTLKRGRCVGLAQEPLKQITVVCPSNVLNAETSNTLVSLSYTKLGNVAIFATTWKVTRKLTGKTIGPKKRRLAAPQATSFSKQKWMAHLVQTEHVPATGHTHAAHGARVSEPRFRRCFARALFRKALPALSSLCAPLQLLVDSNAFRGIQRHGIGFEQRATRSSVFNEVLSLTVLAHVSFTKNTSKLARVSRFHFAQEQQQVRHSWTAFGTHSRYGRESVTIHSSGNCLPTAGNETLQQAVAKVDAENKQLLHMAYCGRGTEQPRIISRQHSTTSPMPSHAVLKNLRLAIPRLWLMWYKNLTSTRTPLSATGGCTATARLCGTASWRQRSEAAHSQVTQWQAVGFCCTSSQNSMPSPHATPELQIHATLPFAIPDALEALNVGASTFADDIIREIPGTSAENVIAGINRSNDVLDTANVDCTGFAQLFCLIFGEMFSCGALPRSRDRGRPLGLATATRLRAGRSIPSQPPLLLARGERRSARDTQRSRAQRGRKQAPAFWWGARSALGAPGLVTVQSDNPVTEHVAPAPSSSCVPPPDVTYAAFTLLTDYMAPAPVIGYIVPARAALCSL